MFSSPHEFPFCPLFFRSFSTCLHTEQRSHAEKKQIERGAWRSASAHGSTLWNSSHFSDQLLASSICKHAANLLFTHALWLESFPGADIVHLYLMTTTRLKLIHVAHCVLSRHAKCSEKNLSERSMHWKENQYHSYVRILNTVTSLSVNRSVTINWHLIYECFQLVKKNLSLKHVCSIRVCVSWVQIINFIAAT